MFYSGFMFTIGIVAAIICIPIAIVLLPLVFIIILIPVPAYYLAYKWTHDAGASLLITFIICIIIIYDAYKRNKKPKNPDLSKFIIDRKKPPNED